MLDKQVTPPCQADLSLSSSILCLVLTYYAFFQTYPPYLCKAAQVTEVYLHFSSIIKQMKQGTLSGPKISQVVQNPPKQIN
jgi:hypothetical protein